MARVWSDVGTPLERKRQKQHLHNWKIDVMLVTLLSSRSLSVTSEQISEIFVPYRFRFTIKAEGINDQFINVYANLVVWS